MGCINTKSRNNRLNSKVAGVAIVSHPSSSLSNSLLERGDNGSSNEALQSHNKNNSQSSYQAPSIKSVAMTPEETLNPMASPSTSSSSSAFGNNKPNPTSGKAPVATSAVRGSSILQFEHPFKRGSFSKRGQTVKSWKQRHFVMDGGELMYFKDSSLAEKLGEVCLCGATCSYIDQSSKNKGALIELHCGKRDLLIEIDSVIEAEDWTSCIYDVIIREDLMFLNRHYRSAPQVQFGYRSVLSIPPADPAGAPDFSMETVVAMCDLILVHYHDALAVLQEGVDCIIFGVDKNGLAKVETGCIKLRHDREGLLWCSIKASDVKRVRKQSINRAMSTSSVLLSSEASSDPTESFNSIMFGDITDVIIGNLSSSNKESMSSRNSIGGDVLSIVTRAHSLDIELDCDNISAKSVFASSQTLAKISSLSGDNSDGRNVSRASLFSVRSSFYPFGADASSGDGAGSASSVGQTCPKVVSRHPFFRALRMVMLIHGHLQLIIHAKSSALSCQASKGEPAGRNGGAVLRPVDRAREKVPLTV